MVVKCMVVIGEWDYSLTVVARDYEATPSSALPFFILAAAIILVRRIAKAL